MEGLRFEKDSVVLTSNINFTPEVISDISKYSKIYIGGCFTSKLDSLPSSIKIMSIYVEYNREIGEFPPFLEYLSTESKYQDYVGLPHTLKTFINKNTLNQKTVDSLLYGLEYIYINHFSGENFVLPNSVQTIMFNKKIKGFFCSNPITQFPVNLKKLVLPQDYNYDLDGLLPNGLESLTLSNDYDKTLNHLPPSLKHLTFNCSTFNHNLDNLPNGLESLIFKDYCSFNKSIDNLPDSIKILDIASARFDLNFTNLPNGLESLIINLKKTNYESLNNLPNNIKKLKIILNPHDFTDEQCQVILSNIQNSLSIKSLTLVDFNVINILPLNLKHLKVHKKFTYEFKQVITADLTNLDFVEINDPEEQAYLNNLYPTITFI